MDDSFELPPYASSSAIHTPPSVVYDNLAAPSHSKAKALRREPSALVDCHRVLTRIFGHQDYKGKQREIVEAAVRGADIFVLAPTGMGKSLCFQVPAVADTHGITIVVSPLLALMKNQVAALRAKSVKVIALTSETTQDEKNDIIRDLSSGHPVNRLLYITPEKLLKSELLNILDTVYENKELNRLVIDEAHCISEWGHDFRAEYRRLGVFRERFEGIPIMALTATATPAVQTDIIRSLGMSPDHLVKVVHPFNRGNLYYEIRYLGAPNPTSQFADILNFILTIYDRRQRSSAGIIYCRTRAGCDELSQFLRGQGIRARPYHRGLKPRELDSTLREWTRGGGSGEGGSVDVVCATIAFGLGIDKGDVRYIIHYDLPKSLEGYYQETGAQCLSRLQPELKGTQGAQGETVLQRDVSYITVPREDAIRLKRLIASAQTKRTTMALRVDGPEPSQRAVDSLKSLIDFAESTTVCRHVAICRYFGEPIDLTDTGTVRKYCNKMCDICKNPDKTKALREKLSSQEFAATQVPAYPARNDDADEDRPRPEARDAWKKNGKDIAALKRTRTDADNAAANRYSKKSKKSSSAMPPSILSLNSMPFQSFRDLKKPFKIPSAAVGGRSGQASASKPAEPIVIDSDEDDDQDECPPSPVALDQQDQEIVPDHLQFEDDDDGGEVESHKNRESSPIVLSELGGEVEASFSQKIPLAFRQEGQENIRKALHKTFLRGSQSELDKIWNDVLRLDHADRYSVLDDAAKALEFAALSMCSTADGYTRRVEGTLNAIRFLSKNVERWKDGGSGDDWEDALEVLEAVKMAC
ncbi:ATP-dependent DNA helicase [Mycena amicta]|nr:ATP-dependent DNA helicase [Mycena amicta]